MCLKSEQNCSKFRNYKKGSKTETKVHISDTFWKNVSKDPELFKNWKVIEGLKSLLVQISETYCIEKRSRYFSCLSCSRKQTLKPVWQLGCISCKVCQTLGPLAQLFASFSGEEVENLQITDFPRHFGQLKPKFPFKRWHRLQELCAIYKKLTFSTNN